jgi:hypothetical protein
MFNDCLATRIFDYSHQRSPVVKLQLFYHLAGTIPRFRIGRQKIVPMSPNALLVPQFTLPKNQCLPSGATQCVQSPSVKHLIAFDFLDPVSAIILMHARSACAIVSVPKASMDENDLPPSRKDHIGFAGEILTMEPVTAAHAMSEATHHKFRRRVAAFTAHSPAALLWRFIHRLNSIFKLGSVSNSSTTSL